MPSGSSSTSKAGRFNPLSILLETKESSQPESSTSARSCFPDATTQTFSDDDEEDFMSDKYIVLADTEPKRPLTYTDKRRKLEAHYTHRNRDTRSWKQREEEAREEGLDRDLLAEAEIVAGGGTLPPEDNDGTRRWDKLKRSDGEGEVFKNQSGDDTVGGEDGTTKAMRMMLAMGYRRGEALGRRMQDLPNQQQEEEEEEEEEEGEKEEEELAKKITFKAGTGAANAPIESDPEPLDTDEEAAALSDLSDSQTREGDEYLTGGVFSVPFSSKLAHPSSANTRPLRPDQRWLGLNRRAGIGMIPRTPSAVASAIRAKASSTLGTLTTAQSEAEVHFRARISREHQERHDSNLLSRARKTLIELDTASGTQYSPLWLDSDLYNILSGHTVAPDMNATTIDERMQKDACFKQAVELLQSAFSAEDKTQVQEADTFCNLEINQQLELVLSSLRHQHQYCLFCGCGYEDQQDLAAHCPGETEGDHD
uniref:DUF4187 domain-containing protein n=1 Tax=Melanopsichium pennsylvanicum 4 TaxID=1398559 RepID=A0A077QQJ0_9BASI|nr:conserved hypothetical protein [Melanopsichium pennsylvanicum 4]